MATTKTKRPKKESGSAQGRQSGARRQIAAVLLFAAAVFLLFLVFIKGQNVWETMHSFLFGVFGVCTYIWPFLLGYVAVVTALDKPMGRTGTKVWQSAVLIILVCAAVDIIRGVGIGELGFGEYISGAYSSGIEHTGGGFFGALVGWPIYKLFGRTGAIVTVILLIFIFFMLVTGMTLIMLFKYITHPVRRTAKSAEEAYMRRMQAEEEQTADADGEEATSKRPKFNIDVPIGGEKEKRRARRGKGSPSDLPADPEDEIMDRQTEILKSHTRSGAAEDKESASGMAPVPPTLDEIIKNSDKSAAEESTAKQAAESAAELHVPDGAGIAVEKEGSDYRLPPVSLLNKSEKKARGDAAAELKNNADRLVDVLRSFGVETRIVDISRGPTVTRYELQPSAGVKISKITGLADDIALNLATAGVRIEAPIPNKPAVGIEVPNKQRDDVGIRELIDSAKFVDAKSKLTVVLGKDISGAAVMTDLAKMPHLLIAGATGSGKSVCVNSMIMSMLYKATPDEVKLLMIDPKQVELGVYNGIPHMIVPVVTDPRRAAGALGWAVTEMLRRYKLFSDNGVRNLDGYNDLAEISDDIKKEPQIVIIIDELADLMMAAPNEVEDSICRLAQMARAAGMHLVIATQRPSVDVITGIIKANIPSRIALTVAQQVDSRTILDMGGAEKLLGRGDMLFYPVGMSKPMRVQGCFVTDGEIEKVTDFIKSSGESEYDEFVMEEIEKQTVAEKGKGGETDGETDSMFSQAVEVVVEAGQAATSLLQRRLKLGYARAARIMDEMEQRGIVGPSEGSKPRKVLISKQQWIEMQARSSYGDI